MMGDELTLLVVDDDENCRELFAIWLREEHAVRTATDGESALEELDGTVDVVLLDREMPGPSGREVTRRIADGPHDPYVAMVTSRAPDFDIVETPIDEYVRKPVERGELTEVLTQFQRQETYKTVLDEFFALTARLAALETAKSDAELAASEEYARLRDRVAEKRAEVDRVIDEAGPDWAVAFRTCGAAAATRDSGLHLRS